MRKTVAAVALSVAAVAVYVALALTTTVGYHAGHVGVDVAGVVAADISANGLQVGPVAATEDSDGVRACAVHGDRMCAPAGR